MPLRFQLSFEGLGFIKLKHRATRRLNKRSNIGKKDKRPHPITTSEKSRICRKKTPNEYATGSYAVFGILFLGRNTPIYTVSKISATVSLSALACKGNYVGIIYWKRMAAQGIFGNIGQRKM